MNGYNFVSRELCKALSWMFQFASNRTKGFINPSSNLQETIINDEISNNKFKHRFQLNIIININRIGLFKIKELSSTVTEIKCNLCCLVSKI